VIGAVGDYDFWCRQTVSITPEPIMRAWREGRKLNVALVKEALTPSTPKKRHRKVIVR
jgi:hypothetical protein